MLFRFQFEKPEDGSLRFEVRNQNCASRNDEENGSY